MPSTFRNIPGPKNEVVRCLLVGGEPVAVVYDLPTGRHPSMTTQVVTRIPSLKKLVYKADVGTRTGYVADRACLRELADVYSLIEPKGLANIQANTRFVHWIRQDLIPYLDAWDKELRDTKTPVKPNEIFLGVTMNGIRFQGTFQDPEEAGITLVVNGLIQSYTPNQLAAKLGQL